MPRFKLKAFDPHNPDAKARSRWDALQRGETKHKYDLPPTQPGKRQKRGGKQQQQQQQKQKQKQKQKQPATTQQPLDDERLSNSQRRFRAQILAAKGQPTTKPNTTPDTEARDKRTIRKDDKAKRTQQHKDNDDDQQHSTHKRRRTATEEEREADEQQTRAQWEDKVATMTGKRSRPSTAATDAASPPPPPSPPAREFAGAEHIPFGFQVDRPPIHLTQLKNKRAVGAAGGEGGKGGGKSGGGLSMEQYAKERQQAQEAYAEMRKRRREAEKT